jgi:hypothetical protein
MKPSALASETIRYFGRRYAELAEPSEAIEWAKAEQPPDSNDD